ncbi:MAG: DUF1850 domain-containing protein [Aquabacterium sp.]
MRPAAPRWALAWPAGLAVAGGLALAAPRCELVLSDHRAGTELARLPLDSAAPQVRVAFVHSVLGTPVVDHYRFTPQARLVEERFEGEGYGLPHAAGPGQTLRRDGTGWVLQLDRAVDPLVVRALPAQRMRLLLDDGTELPLGTLGAASIRIDAKGCSA